MKSFRYMLMLICSLLILGCGSKEKRFVNACHEGNYQKVMDFFQKGIPKDTRYGTLSCLIAASYKGHIEIVDTLLELGVNADFQNKAGSTALLLAIGEEHYEIASRLVQYGANLNLQNEYGATALMLAGNRNQGELVHQMLERGADISIKNNEGETALQQALERGHTTVIELLQQEELYQQSAMQRFSEDQRKQIWRELSQAWEHIQRQNLDNEDKATATEETREQLLEKHNMSLSQLREIQEEGRSEDWAKLITKDTPPSEPIEQIRAIIHENIGETTYDSQPKIINLSLNNGLLDLQFRASENLTTKMTRGVIERDVYTIVEALALRSDITELFFRPYLTLVDEYGNEKEVQVGKFVISSTVYSKVNWSNMYTEKFMDLVKRHGQYQIHKALQP